MAFMNLNIGYHIYHGINANLWREIFSSSPETLEAPDGLRFVFGFVTSFRDPDLDFAKQLLGSGSQMHGFSQQGFKLIQVENSSESRIDPFFLGHADINGSMICKEKT
jgi:hypothetical protein